VNDLVLEFLVEVDDWPALREMSDEHLAERFTEWLQRRRPERYPTLQLPLSEAAE
jgi:hypothetical protein